MSFLTLVQDGPRAGWLRWQDSVSPTFLDVVGPSFSRSDGPCRATVIADTRPIHGNRMGALHGGFLAAFADHAYFAGIVAMGRPEQADAVTVELSVQYLSSGKVGTPLRAEVELLRETGRLLFLRMTVAQEDELILSSTAIGRKAPQP